MSPHPVAAHLLVMDTHPQTTTETSPETTPAPVLLAAASRQGHLVHAIRDNQEWRENMGLGRLIIYAFPLCAPAPAPHRHRRSSTLMIVGGHQNPTQVAEGLSGAYRACPRCVRKVEALTETYGALPIATPVQQDQPREMLGAA